MNVFAQSLLDSSNIIAEAALSKSVLPKTIECEIIELKDAAIGLYSVSYMGNIIDVYSSSTTISYDEGDLVLVLIPDGDMSKTKYILGAVNPNGDMYTPTESVVTNKIVEKVNLLYFNDISLCSYTPETITIPFDNQPYIDQLAGYINSKKLDFVFYANVMTKIPGVQQKGGNYGLYLTLPILVKNTDGTNPGGMDEANLIVKMDITTMEGNVYNFKEFIEQKISVVFPDNAVYDTLRQPVLTAFVENFQNQVIGKPDDIFFTNISLRPITVLNLDDNNGNYLTIIASEGSFFAPNTNQSNTKTLSLALKIGGKDKKVDNYACYWFVEDMTVNSANNDGYLAYGGYGWRCLNEKKVLMTESDGSEQVELITNVYTHEVKKADIVTSLRYKCVLVQDSFIIEGKIEIKNLQPLYQIELVTVSGPTHFVKDFGKINLVARIKRLNGEVNISNCAFSTNWLRYKEDGTKYEEEQGVPEFVRINDLVNGWYETEVSYPATYIKDYSNIFCTFAEDNLTGTRTIGTKNIVITTGEDFVYRLSPIIDRTDYKYDAEGNSPKLSNTNYDGPASSVTSVIKPISFEIRDREGKELSENEYKYCQVTWMFPKDSMLMLGEGMTPSAETEDYYYLTFVGKEESNLVYDIQPIFYPEKDNTIILEVSFSGYTLRTSIPFTFLKDGRSGTNGTKFSAVITYNGHAYGEEYKDNDGKILRHRFLPVYISPQWEWESCLKIGIYQPRTENGEYNKIVDYPTIYDNLPTFAVKVCKDGQLIEPSGNYSVSWSMMDPNVCHPWFDIDSQGKLSLNSYFNTSIKNHAWPESYSDFGDTGNVNIPCNVIKAAVTINSNATDTNTKQIIYAYYPIDFIFMSLRESESDFDPNKEYNLPIIEDGFWEAIYAADGTNPQYDNTNPFTFGDNSRVYDLKALAEEEYGVGEWFYGSVNNFIVTDYTNTSFKVKPAHKYANGATQNVIGYKVEFPYNYETERTVIEDKISDIEENLARLQTDYTVYSSFCSYLTSFQHQLDNDGIFSYNNIMKAQLAKCKEMLAARSMVISNLDELYDKVLDMQDYCSDKDITFNQELEDILLFFKNDSEPLGVKNILLLLGDSKVFSDVPEYLVQVGCTNLTFSEESVISNYGLGVYQTLSEQVFSFDELLRTYFNNIAEMKSYYDGLDDFTSFRSIMNNFLNSNTVLNYLTSQANMGEEFKSFKNIQNERFKSLSVDCYSYADINDLLAKMKSSYDTFKQIYYNDKYNTLASNKLQEIHLEECKIQDLTAADRYELVRYYKPIYMAYNPYGNSNMNLWDGQKLYVGDDERYMFAPQFGAGYKDNANRFTGIYMGLESTNEDTGNYTNMKVGIIARHENEETMFLNAKNGAAIFGKSSSGGQIIIDPVQGKGELYSSNYYRSYNSSGVNYGLPTSYGESNMTYQGMKISLSDACIHFGDIYNNNGKFYSGHHSTLTSTEDGFYMDKDGLSIGSKFKVDAGGVLSVGIGATSGDSSRKHWTIDGSGVNSYIAYGTTSLNTSNGQIYIGTDGISLGTGFKVDSNGNITATSGSIAGWNITSSAIECGSGTNKITISSSGSITGPGWALRKDGSGTIGGWNIGTSDNIYTLNSANNVLTLDGTNGKIIGPGFKLDSTGFTLQKTGSANYVRFDTNGNLTINGTVNANAGSFSGTIIANDGQIGSWKINENGFYYTGELIDGRQIQLTPTTTVIKYLYAEDLHANTAITGKKLIINDGVNCYVSIGNDAEGGYHGIYIKKGDINLNNGILRNIGFIDLIGDSWNEITLRSAGSSTGEGLLTFLDRRYVQRGSHRHMIYLQGNAYPTEYTNL